MSLHKISCAFFFIALALAVALAPSTASAQNTDVSKAQVFAGFSWLNAGELGGHLSPFFAKLNSANGWGANFNYNFTKHLGLGADFGGNYGDNYHNGTYLFGPRVQFPSEHFIPFLNAQLGVTHLSVSNPCPTIACAAFKGNHFGAALGGGLDMPLTKHFGLRVIEAEYLYQNLGVDLNRLDGVRLRTGLLFNFGSFTPPTPVAASCKVQPTEIMAGEPVTADITASNFNPKHKVNYDWKTTGGKITGKETTANIDTAGLAPGPYTVTGTATDAKAKTNNTASCTASFTVKEPPKHPPTISCSANPTTVRSGDASTVTAQTTNPDNRPLTVTWSAAGGRIVGTGENVQLDTAGAPAGPINITGTVTDDRGLSANCNASVTVEVPPPPPQVSKLNEIVFPNKAKPWRVDNTAKAILDDVALRLQREPDAKAVVVGYFDPATENKKNGGEKLAEERAVNTKDYLVKEKGIDPSRIEVRTGTAGGNRAEIYLVPPGATFNVEGTQTFDETTVKPAVEKKRKPAAKKAAAPKQ
jgi:outer membrane protein OmpA-like peptidoglycan-associated protein/opacity protein-like surface antigen